MITGSSWFFIMMGAEMGTLVALKIRYTRESRPRIRLALMLVVYAVYSIFLPFFSGYSLSKIPFLGWSMGVGTAGAVAPALDSCNRAHILIQRESVISVWKQAGLLTILYGRCDVSGNVLRLDEGVQQEFQNREKIADEQDVRNLQDSFIDRDWLDCCRGS